MKDNLNSHVRINSVTALYSAALLLFTSPAHGELFRAASLKPGGTGMDIILQEVERRPASSVVDIKINRIGSSVGSSFFLLCSLRTMAQARGGYRYIAKIEEFPARHQMLVAFLKASDADPADADPAFARSSRPAEVIDLEQFAPICDMQQKGNGAQ